MKVNLTQPQRIVAALIYLVLLICIFLFLGGNLRALALDVSTDRSLWFYSGALLIILGKYVAEPFFTKPTDSIANSLAVMIALIGLDVKTSLFAYSFILIYSISILGVTLISVGFKDSGNKTLRWISNSTYLISVHLGSSKVIFSFVFLSSIYSYLAAIPEPDIVGFIILLTFWICIVFFDVIGKIIEFLDRFKAVSDRLNYELGKAIGCENPLLYKVEIDNSGTSRVIQGMLVTVENIKGSRSIGIIINVKQLLGKKWLSIYLLSDEKGNQLKVPSVRSLFGDSKTIMNTENSVFLIGSVNDFHPDITEKVQQNYLYNNKESFIGYVESGTNLNTLRFHVMNTSVSNRIYEGSILTVSVHGVRTLYQVIDGQTREELLENKDTYGFTIGVARKVGVYREGKKELEVISWMPEMFTPVFNSKEEDMSTEMLKELSKTSIGRLPATKYEIPIKDINSLITHNTAVLGILGIGKSCLTFELIQKSLSKIEGLKVICIDVTNEYKQEDKLARYVANQLIESDKANAFNDINAKFEYIETVGEGKYAKQIPDKSGNIEDYRRALKSDLTKFLFNLDDVPDEYNPSNEKRVKIYNPDYHKVSKGEKMGIHVLTPALSPAEKTRIITEETLKILMKFPPTSDGAQARVLFVFEEAHSLVPEWNSIANEGDKTAVNGTAKVILQGRKYGLGSLVITQRTANISKSILNQCNTIFALRVFDDTGKQFLENYIGSDYSNTLPTLEERHAIAVGKALKLKQPIIIQLNDRKHVIQEEGFDNED